MRLQPEAHGSYVTKFVEDFTSAVLKEVAGIATDDRKGPRSHEMVDKLFGDSEIQRIELPTYRIQDDCKALIRFHLRGNVELFERYDFLGKPWKYVDGSPEIAVKGDRDVKNVKTTLSQLFGEVDRALTAFTLAHTEAKVKLIQLANNSYWEKVRLEEALEEAEIARDPDEDEDYGEIPS